jgi:two-component sensor histidine kinase
MSGFIHSFIEPKNTSGLDFWEIQLKKKINIISLLGLANFILGTPFFFLIDAPQFIPECIFSLIALPLVVLINRHFHYIYAIYGFFISSFIFTLLFNLKMGKESYMILFYFPIILSMVHLIGRKETLKHLIVLMAFGLLTIILIAIGFRHNYLQIELNDKLINNIFVFNIIISFSTTMAFMITIINDYIKQEELIKKMLKEKEVLLAEVFHRVKNNLNIVTSLLNLKKNSTESAEVKEALEECRSRVFSMALVHQNIFNNHEVGLNFKTYIENLVSEIANSLGMNQQIELALETEEISLNLSSAIPCGIILNEIITNSYKYALSENNRLQIQIIIKQKGEMISLEVSDNGPGISEEILAKDNTLGLELIETLSEQLGGEFSFSNNSGLVFHLSFKQ